MIKSIAIDLGGVYFTEGKSIAVNKLEREQGYNKQILLSFFKSQQSLELRKGLISDEQFWESGKKALPAGYDVQLIRQTWYDSYTPHEDIIKLVTMLKGKYQLIVFSENIKARVDYLDNKYRFRKQFDTEVYSFDHHLLKYYDLEENKGFYEALIAKSGCKPEEILAIDDGSNAIEMLKSIGIHGILYTENSTPILQEQLQKYDINLEF